MTRFVLDNTVTMAWCFTDEATDFTETLLNRLSNLTDTALVPALWLYEVVNVVELAVRKSRITKDKAFDFLQSLAELPIEVEDLSRTEVFVSVRTRWHLEDHRRHRASSRDYQDPHPSRFAHPSTAPSSGQDLRSIPTGLIPHRTPLPSGSAPEPTLPLSLARPRRQNARNIAPRAEEGPENAPIPGRGPVA